MADKALVEFVDELARDVRRGVVTAVGYAAIRADGQTVHGALGDVSDGLRLIGAIAVLQQAVTTAALEDEDEDGDGETLYAGTA